MSDSVYIHHADDCYQATLFGCILLIYMSGIFVKISQFPIERVTIQRTLQVTDLPGCSVADSNPCEECNRAFLLLCICFIRYKGKRLALIQIFIASIFNHFNLLSLQFSLDNVFHNTKGIQIIDIG